MSSDKEDDRIDFSALDPSRDPARWEKRIAVVMAAAHRGRPRRLDHLQRSARSALAAAAAVAFVLWGAALLHRSPAATPADSFAEVVRWSRAETSIDAYQLLEAIRGQ
jgi:hypothetical protein